MTDLHELQIGNIYVNDVRYLFPDSPPYTKRDIGDVTHCVVHHSVTSEDVPNDEVAERLVIHAIWNYHRNVHLWPGIGYHLVIMPSGRMYATGGIEDVRYHSGSNNHYTWGVCMIGDYSNHQPNNVMLESLRKVIAEMSYGLGKQLIVKGHFEFKDLMPQEDRTACPGKMWDFWKGIVIPATDGEVR